MWRYHHPIYFVILLTLIISFSPNTVVVVIVIVVVVVVVVFGYRKGVKEIAIERNTLPTITGCCITFAYDGVYDIIEREKKKEKP